MRTTVTQPRFMWWYAVLTAAPAEVVAD